MKKLRDAGVKAEIQVLQLDVTNDDDILSAVKFVESKHGKLDGECISVALDILLTSHT